MPAEMLARQVLQNEPNNVAAMGILAIIATAEGRPQQAVELLEKTITLSPTPTADQFYCLGESYRTLVRLPEAERALNRSLELNSQNADAHISLAMCRMLQGDFARGWAEFEWRWDCSTLNTQRLKFEKPAWDGSDPAGKTILLWAEQGMGDVIQCARYALLLVQRGAKVVMGVQPPLVRLLQTLKGVSTVTSAIDQTPPFDLHAPIFGLPYLFGTTLQTVPAEVPYMFADESLTAKWKARLADDPAPRKIGLIWGGGIANPTDAQRSVPITALGPLAAIKDASFYSLQSDERVHELSAAPRELRIKSLGPELKDFADTAAVLMNLDLLITVDTAAAHLAGALGRPVWTLLAFFNDWRWMLERSDTPWYPTMRLFRQKTRGDWGQVMRDVAKELAK